MAFHAPIKYHRLPLRQQDYKILVCFLGAGMLLYFTLTETLSEYLIWLAWAATAQLAAAFLFRALFPVQYHIIKRLMATKVALFLQGAQLKRKLSGLASSYTPGSNDHNTPLPLVMTDKDWRDVRRTQMESTPLPALGRVKNNNPPSLPLPDSSIPAPSAAAASCSYNFPGKGNMLPIPTPIVPARDFGYPVRLNLEYSEIHKCDESLSSPNAHISSTLVTPLKTSGATVIPISLDVSDWAEAGVGVGDKRDESGSVIGAQVADHDNSNDVFVLEKQEKNDDNDFPSDIDDLDVDETVDSTGKDVSETAVTRASPDVPAVGIVTNLGGHKKFVHHCDDDEWDDVEIPAEGLTPQSATVNEHIKVHEVLVPSSSASPYCPAVPSPLQQSSKDVLPGDNNRSTPLRLGASLRPSAAPLNMVTRLGGTKKKIEYVDEDEWGDVEIPETGLTTLSLSRISHDAEEEDEDYHNVFDGDEEKCKERGSFIANSGDGIAKDLLAKTKGVGDSVDTSITDIAFLNAKNLNKIQKLEKCSAEDIEAYDDEEYGLEIPESDVTLELKTPRAFEKKKLFSANASDRSGSPFSEDIPDTSEFGSEFSYDHSCKRSSRSSLCHSTISEDFNDIELPPVGVALKLKDAGDQSDSVAEEEFWEEGLELPEEGIDQNMLRVRPSLKADSDKIGSSAILASENHRMFYCDKENANQSNGYIDSGLENTISHFGAAVDVVENEDEFGVDIPYEGLSRPTRARTPFRTLLPDATSGGESDELDVLNISTSSDDNEVHVEPRPLQISKETENNILRFSEGSFGNRTSLADRKTGTAQHSDAIGRINPKVKLLEFTESPARIANQFNSSTGNPAFPLKIIHRKPKHKPMLIKNLNTWDEPKTVGKMVFNPTKGCWEGNEEALKDFDKPSGPALITNIGGSKVPKIVGGMLFDPVKMCWVRVRNPDGDDDEEEEDVFADIDSDDDAACTGAGEGIRGKGLTGPAEEEFEDRNEFKLNEEQISRITDASLDHQALIAGGWALRLKEHDPNYMYDITRFGLGSE
eukprot:Nk52_evm47s153 gene=Nk52_evmTU47s153